MEGSRRGLSEGTIRHLPGGTEKKTTKSLNQDGRSPDLNPGPREYVASVLTTRLQRSLLISEGTL